MTAYEDGMHRASDPDVLDRARDLNRVLFTRDDDLVVEAVSFAGVIYAHQLRLSIGATIDDLYLIATAANESDLLDIVQFLPL